MCFLPCFLPFGRARSRQWTMLGALSALAAVGGWGCPDHGAGIGPTISGSEFAYVTNRADNTVSAYAVTAGTGTLKSIGTTNVGKSPSKIVSLSLGQKQNYVYVLNQQDSTISQFSVNANGTLAPLSTPTVALGTTSNDMALSADGFRYNAFTSGNSAANDTREYRVYVTTGAGSLKIFGINAGGSLSLKSELQSLNTPVAVNTVGPDYAVNAEDGFRFAPHDLDGGVAIANSSANTVTQYSLVPLSQGGLKLLPPALPSGQSPSALAGTSRLLAVGNTQDHTVSFYLQNTNMVTYSPAKAPATTFDTVSSPVSITTGGLLRGANVGLGDTSQRYTTTLEYVYVATTAGAIYTFDGSGKPLLNDPQNASSGPITVQVAAQPLFLKAYREWVYVVKQNENTVTAYQEVNESNFIAPLANLQNGQLYTDGVPSAATGHAPTAITFLNTSTNTGAVQTTIH